MKQCCFPRFAEEVSPHFEPVYERRTAVNLLRTAAALLYLFGYMIIHYPILRKGEKLLAAGDTEAVSVIVREHVPKWCRTILSMAGADVEVTGTENIPAGRPCVFVANHRSYFDIPVLLTSLDAPHGILAKDSLKKIPLINRWMTLLGCVFVVREDVRASVKALNEASAAVSAGNSFIIFPEGTRWKGEEGEIGEFKNGAFRIAVKNGAPLVPAAITGTRALFEGHGHIMTPGKVTVRILPPIETASLSKAEQKLLPARVEEAVRCALQNEGSAE